MSRMSRWNYLSENTSTDSDLEYPNIGKLIGYRISGPLDRRLIKSATRSKFCATQELQFDPGQMELSAIKLDIDHTTIIKE